MAAKTETTQANDFFHKANADTMERMTTAFEEAAKMQRQSVDQAMKQFDEMSKIFKSTVNYQLELQEQMRQTILENAKRSVEFMTMK